MFFNLHRSVPQKHRPMKNFVSHCNRSTVVARFLSLYKRKGLLEGCC